MRWTVPLVGRHLPQWLRYTLSITLIGLVLVAVAFLAPGGLAADLGPPDILFFALFLAATVRWGLRPTWTWLAMTAMYSLTLVIANLADINGLPALPFLSFGFLVANADLLWRRLRPAR